MLVLSRKIGQEVVLRVGEHTIRVVVSKVIGDKVRIGFDAPKSVHILRSELDERPAAEAQTS